MFGFALQSLGPLGDDFQLSEVAPKTLLSCGRRVRYLGMLLSDAGKFLVKFQL